MMTKYMLIVNTNFGEKYQLASWHSGVQNFRTHMAETIIGLNMPNSEVVSSLKQYSVVPLLKDTV